MSRSSVVFGVVVGAVVARQLGRCLTSVDGEIAQPKCLLSPGASS
jgi:hypothetical protein